MKIEFEPDDHYLVGAMRDLTSAVVVARLREAVQDCKSFNKHPDDRAYNKKFSAACKIVIEHFGG